MIIWGIWMKVRRMLRREVDRQEMSRVWWVTVQLGYLHYKIHFGKSFLALERRGGYYEGFGGRSGVSLRAEPQG